MEAPFLKELRKLHYRRAFITALVIGFILMIAWAGLAAIIPGGIPMAIMNISLLILSGFIIGIPAMKFLTLFMRRPFAWCLYVLILVFFITLLRSVFLTLFGVI